MRWLIVVSFLLLAAPAPLARAEIQKSETFDYYGFKAGNLSEARQTMFAVTPVRLDGKSFAGQANSHWTWTLHWNETPGRCAVSDVTIDFNTVIQLPKWANVRRAPSGQSREWARYLRALTKHERGHANISLRAVRKLENALRTLPSERTCDALMKRAERLSDRFLKEANRLNADYDKRTGHGRTEGAELRVKAGS